MRKRTRWRICYGTAILLSIITFTPLVTPVGVYEPVVLGMPRTLWVGILVTVGFVVLTAWATRLYPVSEAGEEDQR